MYTSGTTGDPKGVLISNENIITLLAGIKRVLESVNERVSIFLLWHLCFTCKTMNVQSTPDQHFLFN